MNHFNAESKVGSRLFEEAADVFQLLDDEELMALPDPKVLIKDTLWLDNLCVIGGQPNTFKSFLALEMALSIATGRRDMWGRPIRRSGGVVYVAAEGAAGVKKRVAAWKRHHGVESVPNFHLLPHPVQFGAVSESGSVRPNTEPAKLVRTVRRWYPAEAPVLLVIDTLARCTVGVNESSPQDMGHVVKALDDLRKAFGRSYPGQTPPCVLVIHHSTKSGSSVLRGSALEGATDAVTYMEKERVDATTADWITHRVKDDEFPRAVNLQFNVVNLWLSEYGDQVTSGVLTPTGVDRAAEEALAFEALVIEKLTATPGLTKSALCAEVGGNKVATGVRVDDMAVRGVIRMVKDSRAYRYFPA